MAEWGQGRRNLRHSLDRAGAATYRRGESGRLRNHTAGGSLPFRNSLIGWGAALIPRSTKVSAMRDSMLPMLLLQLGEITIEEVIKERSNQRDRPEPGHSLRVVGDGGLYDIGAELKGECRNQPPGIAEPHVAALRPRASSQEQPDHADDRLHRSGEDHQQREAVQEDDGDLGHMNQPAHQPED